MAREHKAGGSHFVFRPEPSWEPREMREGAGGKTDTKLNQSNWKIGSASFYEEIMASLGIKMMTL